MLLANFDVGRNHEEIVRSSSWGMSKLMLNSSRCEEKHDILHMVKYALYECCVIAE